MWASKYNNVTNVAHRRTGERAENVTAVDILEGVYKCVNAVKYNKKGEKRRETWNGVGAMCRRVVGTRRGAGILASSIFVAGESACS